MTRIVLSFCVMLLVPLTDLAAQEAPKITPGVKVRLSAPNVAKKKITGAVVSFDAGALVVKPEGQTLPLTIPQTAVTWLEMSQGRRRSGGLAAAGAVLGLFGGGWLGYLIPTAAAH